MKKALYKIMIVVMIISICCSLTACGGSGSNSISNDQIGISLVIGAHKNFPAVSLSSRTIYDEIYSMAYSYGNCSVIVVDGDPYLNADYNIEKPDKDIDEAKHKQIAKQNTSQIILESQQAVAKTAEFDTLTAISKSAGCLRSLDHSKLNMLIYDSGFSTTGLLNFAKQNIIDSNLEKLIAQMKDLHAIPDLSGIRIVWVGLGEVCDEQHKLTGDYKYKLKNIWNAIITAGGGSVTFDESSVSSEGVKEQLPKVSTIPIIEKGLDIESLSISENVLEQPKKFDNETVKFVGDSDAFIDRTAAIAALKPVAEYLKTNSSVSITIAGMTASTGSEQGCKELSLKRAYACKNLLVEMGVLESRITCIGLGRSQNSLRADDLDANGNLVEPYASQNRAVYIIDSSSEYIKTIVN